MGGQRNTVYQLNTFSSAIIVAVAPRPLPQRPSQALLLMLPPEPEDGAAAYVRRRHAGFRKAFPPQALQRIQHACCPTPAQKCLQRAWSEYTRVLKLKDGSTKLQQQWLLVKLLVPWEGRVTQESRGLDVPDAWNRIMPHLFEPPQSLTGGKSMVHFTKHFSHGVCGETASARESRAASQGE